MRHQRIITILLTVLPENLYTLKFLTFFMEGVSVGPMVIGTAKENQKS